MSVFRLFSLGSNVFCSQALSPLWAVPKSPLLLCVVYEPVSETCVWCSACAVPVDVGNHTLLGSLRIFKVIPVSLGVKGCSIPIKGGQHLVMMVRSWTLMSEQPL